MAIRMTPTEIRLLKQAKPNANPIDQMPRVQNDSPSTRAMWSAPAPVPPTAPEPTLTPLSPETQAAVDAFRAECQQICVKSCQDARKV